MSASLDWLGMQTTGNVEFFARAKRKPTPTHCVAPGCGIPIIPQKRWAQMGPEQRKGIQRHGGGGLCYPHWRRQRTYGDLNLETQRRCQIRWDVTACHACGRKVASARARQEDSEIRASTLIRVIANPDTCKTCYTRGRRAGDPRIKGRAEDHLDEWAFMRDYLGIWNLNTAAERLGISRNRLDGLLREARRLGDERGNLRP